MAYTEQITFLLFLKMADEQTKPPYNKPPIVPAKYSWESGRCAPNRWPLGGVEVE
jgi:type I restriction enzyme M protein